jgi:hypothetical protein
LYDLGVDYGEKAELKGKHPDVFAGIKSRYDAWAAEMLPRRT